MNWEERFRKLPEYKKSKEKKEAQEAEKRSSLVAHYHGQTGEIIEYFGSVIEGFAQSLDAPIYKWGSRVKCEDEIKGEGWPTEVSEEWEILSLGNLSLTFCFSSGHPNGGHSNLLVIGLKDIEITENLYRRVSTWKCRLSASDPSAKEKLARKLTDWFQKNYLKGGGFWDYLKHFILDPWDY